MSYATNTQHSEKLEGTTKQSKHWSTQALNYRNKFNFVNGTIVEVKHVKVFQFDVRELDGVDDATIAAYKIHIWKNSEEGSWIMDHSIAPPEWRLMIEPQTLVSRYMISARLIDRDYTFWALKWNNLIPNNA